jgi:hypothetical protein
MWFCVLQLREEKEFENLAKMFLADLIRQECWDDMSVKGRGIVVLRTRASFDIQMTMNFTDCIVMKGLRTYYSIDN